MKIKTVTWNIGGGKLRKEHSDSGRLDSYTIDGIEEIVEWLADEDIDIITLQETQKNMNSDQVSYIAKKLGYKYFLHDSTSESHIDSNYRLGHAIISRYPISNHQKGFFINPKVKIEWEDGSIATSFDKGYTSCSIKIEDIAVSVTTLHLIPFRRFNIKIDTKLAKSILSNVDDALSCSADKILVQGDFNIDDSSLVTYLPRLFSQGLSEVTQKEPTTPKGRKYDHILYKGMSLLNYRVDSKLLTDHFPIIGEFETS